MNTLYIALGFDCDRPRGDYVNTSEGREMAKTKLTSLEKINQSLNKLNTHRTIFICGEFLASMAKVYGESKMREVFAVNNPLIEIADHTYSHNILKPIPSRPKKYPICIDEILIESQKNIQLFQSILNIDSSYTRGFRAPLGHYNGLIGDEAIQNALKSCGFKYVSSDLRDQNHSLFPKIKDAKGNVRQPYYYNNSLLEIPSHGWQDTAFLGLSRTPLLETYPKNYYQIISYFKNLLLEAKNALEENNTDLFICLTLHPYNVSHYDLNNRFFSDLNDIVNQVNGIFCTYEFIYERYKYSSSAK